MWLWAVIIVAGICTFLSLYMSFLAFRLGDGGAFLFLGFGLFFGILFVISVIKVAAGKSAFLKKRVDERMSGEPKPVSFVPHWFIMSALISTAIVIVAAILMPLFFK